jgi:hypothetical protein
MACPYVRSSCGTAILAAPVRGRDARATSIRHVLSPTHHQDRLLIRQRPVAEHKFRPVGGLVVVLGGGGSLE